MALQNLRRCALFLTANGNKIKKKQKTKRWPVWGKKTNKKKRTALLCSAAESYQDRAAR